MFESIETFTQQLGRLVTRFEAGLAHYRLPGYSEAQARIDFITPFFKALGWDVENEQGLSHQDRDVLVEKGESDTEGRPDYSFRIGGQTKFFVEAKAPSVGTDRPGHILQAKSYVWNTRQVFFVVLTDFSEFRFYDATLQPDERRPDEGLLFKLKFTEFVDNAGKLWDFSPARVSAGSLDTWLPRDRRAQRLRIPVDRVFLDEMTGWRKDIARDVHRNNPELTAKQLNEVVQRLLDRIVFVRIAEDRRIVDKNLLRDAVEEWEARGKKFHIYDWLNDRFRVINEDFNGEIFKPHLSETVRIDSEVLARVIKRLYPPKSPYRFDVLGVELLGSVYERYLGNTLHVTAKQVHLEPKPEVRKAGGVYYTPQYIVDYIVQNTVGKLIDGKTPKQIERLRILDPACGSGSFLIGAFQYIIDHHVRYLTEHPREARSNPLFPDGSGGYRLSVQAKANILKNNLYGIDIDPQAVEITMMSLYLKVLEGEHSLFPPKQHILPELKHNIICGNSLIGLDVYDQGTLFGDVEQARINAFDWDAEFPVTLKAGGFDAIIGNPPYVRIQAMKEWAPFEVDFYKRKYKTAASGNYDIYVVFVEKALELLDKEGRLGFIVPNTFFTSKYGEPLRSLIATGSYLSQIVHFGDQQVFEGATTYTCLMFLDKGGSKRFSMARVDNLEDWRATGASVTGILPARNATAGEWNFTVGNGAALFQKLSKMPMKLGDIAEIFVGLQTSADTVFLFKDVEAASGSMSTVYSKELDKTVKIESALLKPVIRSGDIGRFWSRATARVLFPYEVVAGKARLISESDMKREFPKAWDYLVTNKALLSNREHGKFRNTGWYQLYPKNLDRWEEPKIMLPYMITELAAFYDENNNYFVNVTTGGFGLTVDGTHGSFNYTTGLLNSKLLDWYLKKVSRSFHGGYLAANKQYIEQLPFREINLRDPGDRAFHDRLAALTDRVLDLNRRKRSEKTAPSEINRIDRDIAATDRKIQELVYQLYEISADEQKIIEEASLPH